MSEDDNYTYDIEGNPVVPFVPFVDDARVMRDGNDIIAIGHDRLEDCPAEGMFIEKQFVVQNSQCPICENPLAEDYVGSRGRRGGNVRRRSSAIYQLGCGHRFHAGCLLDHLDGIVTYGTLYQDNLEIRSREPNETIMNNAVGEGEEGIICPDPNCNKICYTGDVFMTIQFFIGQERDRVPPGPYENVGQYDTAEYTGSDPPSEDACLPNGCTVSGGKRKTKNKIKKKKRTKKKTKKRKKKLNKTKRKNSKK